MDGRLLMRPPPPKLFGGYVPRLTLAIRICFGSIPQLLAQVGVLVELVELAAEVVPALLAPLAAQATLETPVSLQLL
tara:strand:+ start:561 stop:791 length:231 start_codon:yes stop_codon:yes gene_type:complete